MRIAPAAIAGVVAMTIACAGSPTEPSPTPVTLALQTSAWETIGDPQPFPLANAGGALTLEFPTQGSIHYLFTPSPLAIIHGTLSITMRVTTSGPVLFNVLDPGDCGIAPSARPLIWSNGNGSGNYDRWWSNPSAFSLAAGVATIAVPLTAAAWSSVNGRNGNADPETKFQFDKALLNVTRLGLTFGGGCNFGHGVSVTGGTASFAVTEFAIR